MEARPPIDLGDDRHASFAARGTSLDVDPDQLEEFLTTGLLRGFFQRARFEQATAARDLFLSISIGKQSVVPDPHEALGQDVEQEAADELNDVEVHHLLFVGIGGVAVAERNAILFDAQDAVVGDRDAMRVGAEIGKHSFGSCERGLRVNDPVATAQLVAEPRNGSVVAEFSALEGALEAVEEFGAEDLGECANRKQKTFVTRGEEVLLVRGQRASRHDAVQMGMQREVLCPSVEDRGDAERSA